jgi:transcriptional regulator with XRE-family HTH domain
MCPIKPKRIATKAAPPSILRTLRTAERLSLQDCAVQLKCNRSAIHRWETLRCEPEPRLRKKYAKVLGVTVGRLGEMIYELRS